MTLLELIQHRIGSHENYLNDIQLAVSTYHSGAVGALTVLRDTIVKTPWYIPSLGKVDIGSIIRGERPECRKCKYAAHNPADGLTSGWLCAGGGLTNLRPVLAEECCVKYEEVEDESGN